LAKHLLECPVALTHPFQAKTRTGQLKLLASNLLSKLLLFYLRLSKVACYPAESFKCAASASGPKKTLSGRQPHWVEGAVLADIERLSKFFLRLYVTTIGLRGLFAYLGQKPESAFSWLRSHDLSD
jgi:hypothetical protein